MALGDGINSRFGTPATSPFGQPAAPQQPAAPATGRFGAPAAPAAPAGTRFGAPAADQTQITSNQVAASSAQSAEAKAAGAAFAGKFPGVNFTGTPDITLISPDVVIHPGATIAFPDPKVGSITIAAGVEIGATAKISVPSEAPAPGAISGRTLALGGQAAFSTAPVVGAGNAAQASSSPKNLRIDDCTINGTICAAREIVKVTVDQGGSIEGTGGSVFDAHVCAGGKVGGNGKVRSVEVQAGTVIEGSVEFTEKSVALGKNCYIGGSGVIDDCTMEDGSRKEGPGSMKESWLEPGAKLLNGSMVGSRLEAGAVKMGAGTINDDTVPARTQDNR
jgi:hypothetical protein